MRPCDPVIPGQCQQNPTQYQNETKQPKVYRCFTYSDFNHGKYFSFLGVVDAGTSLSTRKAYLVRAHAMKTPRLARNAVIGIVSRYPGLSAARIIKVSVEMFSEMKDDNVCWHAESN